MKRILVATLVLVVSGVIGTQAQQVPAWLEAELPHAFCYTYGNIPLPCIPKQVGTSPSPTPTPVVVTATLLPPSTSTPIPTSTTVPSQTNTPIPPTTTFVPPVPALKDGDFEFGLANWTLLNFAAGVPDNITPDVSPVRTSQGAIAGTVHSGDVALQAVAHYACWRIGVSQQVSVMPGTDLVFSAWGRTWGSEKDFNDFPNVPSPFVNDGLAVGIDPFGGTNPGSSAVVWIEDGVTENYHRVSVQATALSSRVTVYAVLRLGTVPGGCNWGLQSMYGWLDDAKLEVVP